jgi:hypothetical protein
VWVAHDWQALFANGGAVGEPDPHPKVQSVLTPVPMPPEYVFNPRQQRWIDHAPPPPPGREPAGSGLRPAQHREGQCGHGWYQQELEQQKGLVRRVVLPHLDCPHKAIALAVQRAQKVRRPPPLAGGPAERAGRGAAAQEEQEAPLANGGERCPGQHDPGLYPTISQASLDAIDNLEHSFGSQQQAVVPGPVYERSVAYGQSVASAILEWAATDGFSIYNNCTYVPASEPGAWEPTPPLFNPNPLQPCWGMLRPMVLTSGEKCPPPGHPAFSTDLASHFSAAGLEVYNVRLTAEQKTIADY